MTKSSLILILDFDVDFVRFQDYVDIVYRYMYIHFDKCALLRFVNKVKI